MVAGGTIFDGRAVGAVELTIEVPVVGAVEVLDDDLREVNVRLGVR